MNGINCGDKRGSVTQSDLTAMLDKFATLATRLDFLDVATNPLERHACHGSHANKENESASSLESLAFVGKRGCFQWLKIVMDEGHLEPSQPWTGKAVGWPERRMPITSLWTDFCCWFRKQQITDDEMPEEYCFYELLDHLFIRLDDNYEFPPIEQCRHTFALLRQQYECD